MVKRDLVTKLVEAFPGITKGDMSIVLDSLFDNMAQALLRGEAVDVRGLGRLKVKKRGPMKGRNPKTARVVDVPERWVTHFKTAESLIDRINGRKE